MCKKIFKILPILVLVLILLTTATMATEEIFDAENFVGLVLQNTEPDTVTVKLYSGFSATAANLLSPTYTEETDSGVNYYYKVTAASRYYCVAKPTTGYARYNEQRCIYITEEEAAQKTVMDVTPPIRSSNGWDPSGAVLFYTDETMTNIYTSDASQWPQYSDMFTTPAFGDGRNRHQQTTQSEMMEFIYALDAADNADDNNMHVYILGQSNGATNYEKFDIPLVLFTTVDLSGAANLEEAAALVRADSEKNGKLTVHYQAQIHGDEPAACEAALGMIKRLEGEYGEGLLDTMNIYVIPRLNPRGAYKSQRVAYLNGSTVDPNRDFLHLQTAEVQARMVAYNLFEPEVVFDNHEYQVTTAYNRVKWRDMSLCCHPLPNFTQEFQDTALAIAYAAFDQLEEDGLTYRWYNDSVGGMGGNTGSSNTAMRGSIHILMETDGCDRGLQFYERRVAAHASALGGIFAYLDENAQVVKATVQEQRDILVEKGKTYEEEDILIFNYTSIDREDLALDGKYILLDSGTIESTTSTFTAAYPGEITRSRVAPTAYVIPAGESYTETVLALMDKQGISYYNLPAGSSVNLQQYTLVAEDEDGLITEAALLEEQAVTFQNGAYVFTMAQVDREILACLMEPDMNIVRSQKGTLVQQGIITDTDGYFPIYRYIRDLNDDGTVDLTAPAPAAPEGLTAVNAEYIGQFGKITGLDATKVYEYRAEGETSYTAVPAGVTEITNLPADNYYVRLAADGDTPASLYVMLTVEYENSAQYIVYLDGVNGNDENDGLTEDGAVKTFEAAYAALDLLMEDAQENMSGKIVLTGNVTITTCVYTLPTHDYPVVITSATGAEGIIHSSGTSEKRYFTMGGDTTLENMTLKLTSRYSDNYLCAGGYKLVIENTVTTTANKDGNYFNLVSGRHEEAATYGDLTVKGGTWRNVYAGGYQRAHNGNTSVKLSDCTISMLCTSYNYAVSGDVYMELRNVIVKTAVYCGNYSSSSVNGDVTLVLGEGVTAPKIYGSPRSAGNITGTVSIIVDGMDMTASTVVSKYASATGTIGSSVLIAKSGTVCTVEGFDETNLDTSAGGTVVLATDMAFDNVTGGKGKLDLNGNNITSNISAKSGTLLCKDSQTDDYTVADGKYGKLTGTVTNVAAAEGYMMATEDDGVSFHKVDTEIAYAVFSPTKVGLYYSSLFKGDEIVKENVKSFGVALSIVGLPTADSNGFADHCQFSAFEKAEFEAGNEEEFASTVLIDILSEKYTPYSNRNNAVTAVYGRSYIQFENGTYLLGEGTSCTLRAAVEYTDSVWDQLEKPQQDAVLALYERFPAVFNNWNIPTIKELAGN